MKPNKKHFVKLDHFCKDWSKTRQTSLQPAPRDLVDCWCPGLVLPRWWKKLLNLLPCHMNHPNWRLVGLQGICQHEHPKTDGTENSSFFSKKWRHFLQERKQHSCPMFTWIFQFGYLTRFPWKRGETNPPSLRVFHWHPERKVLVVIPGSRCHREALLPGPLQGTVADLWPQQTNSRLIAIAWPGQIAHEWMNIGWWVALVRRPY